MAEGKFRIEFVCLANAERSPMATAIGRRWVSSEKLVDRIEVYSSGTNVDQKAYPFGAHTGVRILRRGLATDELDVHYKKSIHEVLGDLDDAELEKRYENDYAIERGVELLARDVLRKLDADGRRKRNLILDGHNLMYIQDSRQTTADDHSNLVLPMTDGLALKVKAIYEAKGTIEMPAIIPLPEYSGVTGEYEGTLGAGIEVFREVFETLNRAVPVALEKAVTDFKIR